MNVGHARAAYDRPAANMLKRYGQGGGGERRAGKDELVTIVKRLAETPQDSPGGDTSETVVRVCGVERLQEPLVDSVSHDREVTVEKPYDSVRDEEAGSQLSPSVGNRVQWYVEGIDNGGR